MEASQAPPAPDAVPTRSSSGTAPVSPDTPPPLPTEMRGTTATDAVGLDVSAPIPPMLDEAGVRAEAITAGWVYNRVITHVWSYDVPTGVWVWVDGIGWKRLSPVSQFGHTHMTVLSTLATDRNLPIDYHEDASGQIDQILV